MTDTLPFLKELKTSHEGRAFATVLVLRTKTVRQTKSGSDFLLLELADSSGTCTASIWKDTRAFIQAERLESGDVLSISGQVNFYNGSFSPKIEAITVVAADRVTEYLGRLTEVSLFDPQAMSTEFAAVIRSITNPGLLKLVSAIFSEVGHAQFASSPAARSMHHAWRNGLLEHTTGMIKLAEATIPLYPHLKFDRDLVIAGIALHDLCKVQEYTQGLVVTPTIRGRLIGHVAMVYGLIVKHGAHLAIPQETVDALGHIVLSHHGTKEFGAPVVPATPEAILVSQIDLMDSRLGALQSALRSDAGRDVTSYNRTLETEVIASVGRPTTT